MKQANANEALADRSGERGKESGGEMKRRRETLTILAFHVSLMKL